MRSERDGSVSPRSPSSIASGGQLVDHLNDRLIARHAEVDDALLHWQQDAEEGRFDPRLLQCLQLSTAQDNVLALRSWLAAFRSGGSGRLPKPRTTKDEEFDEAWSVLLKTLGTQTAVDFFAYVMCLADWIVLGGLFSGGAEAIGVVALSQPLAVAAALARQQHRRRRA